MISKTFFQNIGKALKELCTSLSQEMTILPEQFHREIDMAQKTTNKDLSQIINQMKLVRKFFATTQVDDYKKCKILIMCRLCQLMFNVEAFNNACTNIK